MLAAAPRPGSPIGARGSQGLARGVECVACACIPGAKRTTSLDWAEDPKHVWVQACVAAAPCHRWAEVQCTSSCLRHKTTLAHLCTASQVSAHVHNITPSSIDLIAAMCLLRVLCAKIIRFAEKVRCGCPMLTLSPDAPGIKRQLLCQSQIHASCRQVPWGCRWL